MPKLAMLNAAPGKAHASEGQGKDDSTVVVQRKGPAGAILRQNPSGEGTIGQGVPMPSLTMIFRGAPLHFAAAATTLDMLRRRPPAALPSKHR